MPTDSGETEPRGIPYSLHEARLVLKQLRDQYHAELFAWVIEQAEAERGKALRAAEIIAAISVELATLRKSAAPPGGLFGGGGIIMGRIDDYEPADVADELRAYAFQGNMRRALAGRKGRAFLRELETALVAMPSKRLAEGVLVTEDGCVCALGAVHVARLEAAGIPRDEAIRQTAEVAAPWSWEFGWYATQRAAELCGVCHPLAFAVVARNDAEQRRPTPAFEYGGPVMRPETPEERYERVLAWVRGQIHGAG